MPLFSVTLSSLQFEKSSKTERQNSDQRPLNSHAYTFTYINSIFNMFENEEFQTYVRIENK